MIYEFKCESCGKEEERDIPMSMYTELKDCQMCTCGGKLKRVLAFDGVVNLCGGCYGIDGTKGGWTSKR